jgi:hypothetical protein
MVASARDAKGVVASLSGGLGSALLAGAGSEVVGLCAKAAGLLKTASNTVPKAKEAAKADFKRKGNNNIGA